jgi:glycosyltransferase involved in cell wall biosynthesis
MPDLMAALDVASSSSYGEGFPNTIAEAMSCGVPCIATDVGDSSFLIGETGMAVPPKDPQALADAWEWILNLSTKERFTLGQRARQRIEHFFKIEQVARHYEDLYEQVLEANR